MRLWMIVEEPFLQALRTRGELIADGRRVWRDFRHAYRWMAEQMGRRIGPPPRPRAYPLWAWAQWSGPNRRPDMRTGGHKPRGTQCYRLTLDVPQQQVVLSDFSDWHMVLNNGYLARSEAEADAFDAELAAAGIPKLSRDYGAFTARVEASWERVFDIDHASLHPAWNGSPETQSIQATFWRLGKDQVRKVERFTAR
ncbi:MAG: DUF3841 domain-containing protein [Magnetospirillum sp.]|nr:DUF3841 domain-containing protein [Magnetospirillum sp.]